MEPFSFQAINSKDALFAQVFDLRHRVLRIPLGLSLYEEDTTADAEDVIWVAKANDQVIACLMLKDLGHGQLKLRQMAVDDAWQAKGVGKLLIQKAELESKKAGYSAIVLHARQYAQGFYEKLGYTVYGDTFAEVGIEHIAMSKSI